MKENEEMHKKQNGVWITFEGGEGAGKTSAIQELLRHFSDGRKVVVTREPGGIPVAEKIRSLILDPDHEMDGCTEALLYAAARRLHYTRKILPALREGALVLCDRFIDSSLAYQGYARGIGIEQVFAVNMMAVEHHMPDLTLYYDLDPEKGMARIRANEAREVNRLDMETLEFHKKVREGYLRLLEKFPRRIVKVDADQPLSQVVAQSRKHIEQLLKEKNRDG